LKQKRKI